MRRPMPESWQEEQEAHALVHPGKICPRCPAVQWDRLAEEAQRHHFIQSGFLLAGLMLLAAVLILLFVPV